MSLSGPDEADDGNHDGLTELIRALRTFVGRQVRDPDAADDLVQDVLAKLVREQATSGSPRSVAAWLFRTARNAIVDRYRQRTPVVTAGDLVDSMAMDEDDGEHDDDMRRLTASFRGFVHALPPHHREALLLTEYEGLSQRQLAERLGVPLSTAKSRVQRARAQLAEALHECCSFELDRRGGVIDYRRRSPSNSRDCPPSRRPTG